MKNPIIPLIEVFESESKQFTEEQQKEIAEILKPTKELKFTPMRMKKDYGAFKTISQKFTEKFKEFGGNEESLGKKIDGINPLIKYKVTPEKVKKFMEDKLTRK